jgi:hypothetical protein
MAIPGRVPPKQLPARVPVEQQDKPPRPLEPGIKAAMDTIMDLTKSDVPKLPEPLFLERIMPILQDTSGKVDVEPWLLVAGTLNRPIDVVDGGGTVLFRVPALQRQLPTRTSEDRRHPLATVAAETALRMRRSPIEAEHFLEHALNARLPRAPIDLEPIKQLNEIFRRYNQPEIPLGKEIAAEIDVAERGAGFNGSVDDF